MLRVALGICALAKSNGLMGTEKPLGSMEIVMRCSVGLIIEEEYLEGYFV
jgi:hypothetical protein